MFPTHENTASALWQSFRKSVDSILFPATCILCERYHEFELAWVCEECMRQLDLTFHLSGRELKLEIDNSIFPVYSGWNYDEQIQKVIHAFKYKKHHSIGSFLGKKLAQKNQKFHESFKKSRLVPVPLYPKRQKERGFNQSERIAQGIAAHSPVEVGLYLKRIVDTKQQAQLSHDERQQNVRDAFALDRHFEGKLNGCHIILVDDVFTTGATMRECAKVVYVAGAKEISGLTIATAQKAR